MPSLTGLAMHTVTFAKLFMADITGSITGGHDFDVVELGFDENEGVGAADNDTKTTGFDALIIMSNDLIT